MKKIFNNPWFVVCMIVAALSVVSLQVILPLVKGEQFDLDLEDYSDFWDEADTDTIADASSKQITNSRVDRELIDWLAKPDRDPFRISAIEASAPVLAAAIGKDILSEKSINTSNKPKNKVVKKKTQMPVLKAIFHKSIDSLVVINGELLGVGKTVDGYSIVAISTGSVSLERQGKRYTLYPSRD